MRDDDSHISFHEANESLMIGRLDRFVSVVSASIAESLQAKQQKDERAHAEFSTLFAHLSA